MNLRKIRKSNEMKEMWKKIVIFFGHVVCVFVLIICIARNGELAGAAEETLQTVTPTVAVTVTSTVIPTETAIPTPTVVPTETSTPTPTVVPTETSTPTPTVIPTETATPTPVPTVTPTPSPEPTKEPTVFEKPATERDMVKQQVLLYIAEGKYSSIDNTNDKWWFRRKKDHVPSGSGEFFDIGEYQGYYRNENVEAGDKVIYMTIDCGYGSSNTPLMLDIFKKHDVKVMFFVTKYFIDKSPEYVKRMVEEGHMVGNHSVTHADLTALTDEKIYEEIIGCEEAFYELTGKQMDLYFRPPEGSYSRRTMQVTEDLGYKTIFWSIAYGDYDKDNQPGKDYVINHFDTYHHNGAIPLMHNDSDSNLEAMDEVLTLLKEQGYRFGTLDELGQ